MWSLKSWRSLVLKILFFSRMVCYIFQVMWSEVEKTSHSRVWCHVYPLLVSWVPMFSWEAGWGCDVMPGLGALRRGWARVSGLPNTGIRLPGCVGQRSNPVLAPVPLSIFRSNSKFDENSKHSSVKYTRPTTTIFCTRHDSVTVVTCAKYRCDRLSIFETRAFWIFIEFRFRSKYA